MELDYVTFSYPEPVLHGQQSITKVAEYENGLHCIWRNCRSKFSLWARAKCQVCQYHVYERTLGILVLTSAYVIYSIVNTEMHSESEFLQLFLLVSNSGL
jgi:hypothetical protein